mmetsp:Transcript_7949/g.23573  ORF Transcript_7949/g.23573 Transcript_7949/m.23573 type:complete len:285 (+) Transcript_7949:523-1377(+)
MAQPLAELLRLRQPADRQFPAPLRDDLHLRRQPRGLLVFLVLPLGGLELDLALQAREAVLHLQDWDQEVDVGQLLFDGLLLLARFAARAAVGFQAGELPAELGGAAVEASLQHRHLFGRLQLHLGGAGGRGLEVRQDGGQLGFELQLLLRPAVAVPHHDDHRAEPLLVAVDAVPDRIIPVRHLDADVGDRLVAWPQDHHRRGVDARHPALVQQLLADDGRAIVVVLLVSLDEGPAVHVAHDRAAIRAQDVEATNVLAERFDDEGGDRLLRLRQDHRITHLLAVL